MEKTDICDHTYEKCDHKLEICCFLRFELVQNYREEWAIPLCELIKALDVLK